MLTSLYQWTLKKVAHPQAEKWLAGISFIESSFFPIPPDVMLGPMALARPERAFRYAAICTIASVIGGAFGYALGFFLFDLVGEPLLAFYGYAEKFESFQASFNDYGTWLVFVFGITFFPFKVITIASGVTGLNFGIFLAASLAARAPRFFIEAALLWRFGAPIQAFVEKRLAFVTTVVVFLGIAGFVALKYLIPHD
ncbi:MAG: YqaA family protein [Pseudomonadota bacterium]